MGMLRIDRASNGRVVLRLSGAIRDGDVAALEQILEAEQNGKSLVLDLKHVTSVDRPAVRLLGCYRQAGTALENCPPYIRDWVARELEAGEE
jgi:anti-anti-sigma regulatory factor